MNAPILASSTHHEQRNNEITATYSFRAFYAKSIRYSINTFSGLFFLFLFIQ